MNRIKVKSSSWVPVQLNEAVIASGVEGLIGIEELTDYKLEENNKILQAKRTIINSSKHLKKQIKSKQRVALPKKIPVLNRKSQIKTNKRNKDKKVKTALPKGIIDTKKGTIDSETKSSNDSPVNNSVLSNERSNEDLNHISSIDDSKPKQENLDLLPWTTLFVPEPIARALTELGFRQPTEIQRLALPPAIKGRRDILGAAETGSGKTLAFGIPIAYGILANLEKELKNEIENSEDSAEESDQENLENEGIGCVRVVNLGMHKRSPQTANKLWGLVLTPTRELAVQIKNHLVAALKYTNIKVVVVVGGMSKEKQQRLLKRQPHIVVATPGRIWELISEGEPHFNNIEDIRYLAIDETDRMTEKDHFKELGFLLEKINKDPAKQKLRQNFVFSATLTLVHELPLHVKLKSKKRNRKKSSLLTPNEKLKKLISLLGITDPKIIDVTKKTGMCELLTESSIVCSHDQKDYYLFYFLQRHSGRTLVFCNSISCVRRLASLLTLLGLRPLPIHANMMQKQRLKNLDRFRDSPDSLLLATDVAARGLDIPNVEHVIHYQVPRTSETYVHRSGRTARANHEGLTLLLIESEEQRQYIRLMKTLKRDKELPRFPIMSDLMDAVKLRVNLARDIDKMQLEYKKATSKFSWAQKAAEEMDLLLDDDEMPEKVSDRAASVVKHQLAVKQKQLKKLLQQSLKPRNFSFKYPTLNSGSTSTSAGSFKSYQSAIETVKAASCEKERKRKKSSKPFKAKKKKKIENSSNTN